MNEEKVFKVALNSKLGWIELISNENALLSLKFIESSFQSDVSLPDCLSETIKQLNEYFEGSRKKFTIPLKLNGSRFQKNVWNYLLEIPYGETVTYSKVAGALGDANLVRAVGNANSNNSIAIIIPCHRVIGLHGDMTGYAFGVWRKAWLLEHEMEYSGAEKQLEMFK